MREDAKAIKESIERIDPLVTLLFRSFKARQRVHALEQAIGNKPAEEERIFLLQLKEASNKLYFESLLAISNLSFNDLQVLWRETCYPGSEHYGFLSSIEERYEALKQIKAYESKGNSAT